MFKRSFIKSFIFLFLLFLSAYKNVSSADFPRMQADEAPISVSSNTMTVHGLEDRALFEGNVVITQGDLQIKADRSDLYMTEPASHNRPKTSAAEKSLIKGGREIARIEVSGHVAVQQGTRHATAEQGVYDRKKDAIVLVGNPEAWEGNHRVSGKVITFFITQKRFLVDESRLVVYPEPKAPKK